jgi:hypothetical protein
VDILFIIDGGERGVGGGERGGEKRRAREESFQEAKELLDYGPQSNIIDS